MATVEQPPAEELGDLEDHQVDPQLLELYEAGLRHPDDPEAPA